MDRKASPKKEESPSLLKEEGRIPYSEKEGEKRVRGWKGSVGTI